MKNGNKYNFRKSRPFRKKSETLIKAASCFECKMR